MREREYNKFAPRQRPSASRQSAAQTLRPSWMFPAISGLGNVTRNGHAESANRCFEGRGGELTDEQSSSGHGDGAV